MREINITPFGKTIEDKWLNDSRIRLKWNTKKQALDILNDTDFIHWIGNGEEVDFVIDDGFLVSQITGGFLNPLLDEVVNRFGEKSLGLIKARFIISQLETYKEKHLPKLLGPQWSSSTRVVIPDIGYELKLDQDWKFTLKCERRNHLYKFLQDKGQTPTKSNIQNQYRWSYNGPSVEVTILTGSTLSVDRVYIRKGVSGYSSVTFYLDSGAVVSTGRPMNSTTTKKLRFFASLKDVNKIVCKWNERTLK